MRTLLELSAIRKAYGRAVILDGVSLTIAEGQKIALVGRNGAGKSTLLRILLDQEEADAGEVRRFPTLQIGAVAQHETMPERATGMSYLVGKSGRAEWACAKMSAQFGLRRSHLAMPAASLSGGFQMRLKLVAMLMEDPNLLVLDEPVNYLDLPTLLLLERFLKTYKGAFIVTSHDREFLDAVADRTAEIERGRLSMRPGIPSEFLARKAEARAFVLKTNKKIQREREHIQAFVDRFRYKASKAKQVQSKLKKISKMIDIDIASLLPTAAIRIPMPHTPPGSAARVEELAAGYDGRAVLTSVSFNLVRGEHVAILGGNGMGKTTLLKTIAGVLPPVDGKCRWWHKADIGYYAQHVEQSLKPDDTVMRHLVRSAAPDTSNEAVLKMAGDFLFKDDDLEKLTGVLSGGERSRLCLAGLLLARHNVLLLDEPTNHLDAETSESLAAALSDWPGTVVFVSHSQSFIQRVGRRIFEVRDGRVRQYPGAYGDYLDDLAVAMDEDVALAEEGIQESAGMDADAKREAHQASRDRRRRQQKIEENIRELDKERGEILKFYFENPTDYAPDKRTRLTELDERLARLEKEWLRVEEEGAAS
ncbi:MAG: ABC-F family ATP-binding cassette domain-containing protein [Patescibacteria group bacterium]